MYRSIGLKILTMVLGIIVGILILVFGLLQLPGFLESDRDNSFWLKQFSALGDPSHKYPECRIGLEPDGNGIAIRAKDPNWQGKVLIEVILMYRSDGKERVKYFFKNGDGTGVDEDDAYDVFKKKCLPLLTSELPEYVKEYLAFRYEVPASTGMIAKRFAVEGE